MFVWILRLILVGAALTAIYLALAQYSRWNRRKTLEAEYDAAEAPSRARDEFVAEGMARYERSLAKRLLLGVFVIPIAIVALLLTIAFYM